MKAAFYTQYGSPEVLQIRDVAKPKINILDSVFSGEVETVGQEVKNFKVGDAVFGHNNMRLGAYGHGLDDSFDLLG